MDDTTAKPEPRISAAIGTAGVRRARARTQAEGAAILTGPALESFAKGAKFKPGDTYQATEAHMARSARRHADTIADLRLVLKMYQGEPSKVRRPSGAIHQTKLADAYLAAPGLHPTLGERQLREVIRRAVAEGILA